VYLPFRRSNCLIMTVISFLRPLLVSRRTLWPHSRPRFGQFNLEFTLPNSHWSLSDGVEGIESDVHVSKDGVVIVRFSSGRVQNNT
jgi:hypothetical protein